MNGDQRRELKMIMNAFIDGDLETPPLCTVAQNGDAGLVMVLLEKFGADKNCKDTDGHTPLIHAAVEDHVPVVKTLLHSGADLYVADLEGLNAFHLAALNGNDDTVDALLAAGVDLNITANNGTTALHLASEKEHGDVVVALLKAGADYSIAAINGVTALHTAAFSADARMVDALLASGADKEARDDTGSTPLLNAADDGNDEVVETLLIAGAKISACDMNGHSALWCAAYKGHLRVVKTLLAARADVNMVCVLGQSALHNASRFGHNDVARTLLLGGADKDVTDNNHWVTPLMAAVIYGQLAVAVTLLEAGANLTIQSSDGSTALHFAAMNVRVDHVRLLLRWGADERTVNEKGKTPRTVLDELGYGVNEENRESARQLLARAPADRADRVWRRRGWLVILRKRMDDARKVHPKKQKSGVGGDTGGSEGQSLVLVVVAATLGSTDELFRNVVSFL